MALPLPSGFDATVQAARDRITTASRARDVMGASSSWFGHDATRLSPEFLPEPSVGPEAWAISGEGRSQPGRVVEEPRRLDLGGQAPTQREVRPGRQGTA